jgi:signal transduction histidine kinase
LLEDRDGNLWVGVDDGLAIFRDGQFHRIPEPNHQPLGLVVGVVEGSDGSIWAECAAARKLIRVRDFKVQEEFSTAQVPAGRIAADPRGGIWIGTRSGDLGLFRDGVFQEFSVSSGTNPFANQFVAQPDGSVLAAFDDGMVGLRQAKTQRLTTKNGLPCDTVYAFIEDKAQHWWLNSQCGVIEFSDSDLQRWWANPEARIQTRLYDIRDGARPSSRPPFNAAAISPDGRVWFVNSGFVQMLDPARLSRTAPVLHTSVESVVVDRQAYAATDHLTLPPHARDLEVDYTSPTFVIPQQVQFRYRLDGYDRDWKDAGTRRQAFYTDLTPGQYTFRVMARNRDGVWSDHAASLNFSVKPAFYQTAWFRLALVILLLALLWAAYSFRVRHLALQFSRTLEARVNERTRIARDLHDTLLQSFHGLLLRFQSAAKLLPERPDEAKQRLERALDQADAALTEGRDVIQGLRLSALETNDLANGITAIANTLRSDAPAGDSPAIDVEVEGTSRNLNPVVRDEACRIAGEALRNAFRHAQAQRITVEIRYDKRQFRLRVRDDGKGLAQETIERPPVGHFGVHGMHERAAVVGGTLEVWSKPASGTQIELTVPGAIAYDASRLAV